MSQLSGVRKLFRSKGLILNGSNQNFSVCSKVGRSWNFKLKSIFFFLFISPPQCHSYACLEQSNNYIYTVMYACSLLNLNMAPTYLQCNHCTNLINFDTYIIFLYHKYDAKQKIDYKLTGSSSYSSCQDKSN